MLRVDGVSKNFAGLQAVKDVNFEIQEGEIVGLIGPNGAGKTTLFNLISGFIRPDKGGIFFKEKDLRSRKTHEICRLGLTRTFQIVQPFKNLTIFENVLIGALNRLNSFTKAVSITNEIIDLVGFARAQKRYGIDLNIVESKKLEIAKALSTEPSLLLLDEIMAGLNPTEVQQVIDLLMKLNRNGITLLVIEHNMRAIMSISHRLIVLNYGVKIYEGSPEKALKDSAVIDAYLGEEIDASS
jgi:branched-chain amino acid transport system ATP-binding protein